MRTPRQLLADYLKRSEYKGCHGQISDHGMGRYSIQIFYPYKDDDRWPLAKKTSTGSYLVADFDLY